MSRLVRPATILLPLLAMFAIYSGGCRPKETIPGKWFAGKPVEHWLEAIKSPNAKLRRRAAEVLGNVGQADPRSVEALAAALSDTDRRVREEAVLGLSKMGPVAAAAADAIQKAIRTERDPQVLAHAKAALARVAPGTNGSAAAAPTAKPSP